MLNQTRPALPRRKEAFKRTPKSFKAKWDEKGTICRPRGMQQHQQRHQQPAHALSVLAQTTAPPVPAAFVAFRSCPFHFSLFLALGDKFSGARSARLQLGSSSPPARHSAWAERVFSIVSRGPPEMFRSFSYLIFVSAASSCLGLRTPPARGRTRGSFSSSSLVSTKA